MKRFLLDTGALTDYLNKRRPTIDRAKAILADGHRLGVCPPVLGEFYGGLELSDDPTRSMALWRQSSKLLKVWPFHESAAREYGKIYATLRRIGRPMQRIDMQVAAVAFTLRRCTVVSKDSDLRAIPGLTVEDWSVPE